MIVFLRKSGKHRASLPGGVRQVAKSAAAALFNEARLSFRKNNRIETLLIAEPAVDAPGLQIESGINRRHGFVVELYIDAGRGEPLQLNGFSMELKPGLSRDCRMMVNGFQSWSRSEEVGARDRIAPLSFIARPLLAPCGDSYIYRYSGRKGRFHSWSYTYFTPPSGDSLFIGSLDERSGYTIINYDYAAESLLIEKECEGALVESKSCILKLYIGCGDLDCLFEEYFELTASTRPRASKATGWCSWYNYYTAVSEEIIRRNLAELEKSALPIDYFQVDDGWQQAIGDWLQCNEKFPSGMKTLSSEIASCSFKPGLWLAPFICVPSSEIFRRNPQWLLRDRRGRPVKAGFNPGWEGFFYALNFYAPGFQDYLRTVFSQVQEQWGYRMLKLDFLYAAALLPQDGRSRGQVMTEAIDFIDQQTRQSIVLGCGVPLGPAFGRFDYCRIGSDVGPYWEDYLKRLNYPERVATENSLVCTMGRHQLDGRAFRNDPDVFMLRDGIKGINENRMNDNQRYTLFLLNNILGGLVFFSDDIDGLKNKQSSLLRRAFPAREVEIKTLDNRDGLCRVEFTSSGRSYLAYANLSSKGQSVKIPAASYFSVEHFILRPGSTLELEPYQSICLYQVVPCREGGYFLGAAGHLFPGAQLAELAVVAEKAALSLDRHASPESEIYFGLPSTMKSFSVNGRDYGARAENDLNYIQVPYKELISAPGIL